MSKRGSTEALPNTKVTSGDEATDIKVEQALLELNDLKSEAITSMSKSKPPNGMGSTHASAFGQGAPNATGGAASFGHGTAA